MSLEDLFLALARQLGPREAIKHLLAAIYSEIEDRPEFYKIKTRIMRECNVPVDW